MKKEKRLLRVGVLGCGPISQAAHLEASVKTRNADLYAVCDLAEDLVQKIAARFEPRKTFTDYDAMLADPKVEAVVVAIADQFHVDAAIRALKAGKHVLVEKPLGTTIADCERVAAQVRDSKLIAQVGTMKRFDPGIRDAQRFLAEEGGEILALKAWYCDSIYRYIETDNLQPLMLTSAAVRRPKGNPKANLPVYYLLGHGSHLFDIALFLGGRIRAACNPYGKVRQPLLDDNCRVRSWFRRAPRPDHARTDGLARGLSSLRRRGHRLGPHAQPLVLSVK
jgi:predicted dehydrogenase